MTFRLLLAVASGLALAAPGPAQAQVQPELAAALRSGQIGERYDGYLGFASAPSPTARSQANAVNIRRRALYSDLASRRRVTPHDVGIATGCELLKGIGVGQAYMLPDGVWRRRGAGQGVSVPEYCR